jgi:hypothetical protein
MVRPVFTCTPRVRRPLRELARDFVAHEDRVAALAEHVRRIFEEFGLDRQLESEPIALVGGPSKQCEARERRISVLNQTVLV